MNALVALGLLGASFHEPFHTDGGQRPMAVTEGSELDWPHSITAEVEIPEDGAEGVLLCQGTAAGGYSFFIKEGKLRYVHNYVGRAV